MSVTDSKPSERRLMRHWENTIFVKVNVPWSRGAFDFVWFWGYLGLDVSTSTHKEVACKMHMVWLTYFELALARLESQDGKNRHVITHR